MAIGTSLRTASAISASLANTPVYRARRCIANYNPATILNFTVSGSTFASFSASTAIGGAGPADVQVDGGGNLWVANVDPNETATGSNVVKMSTSGTVIKTSPATETREWVLSMCLVLRLSPARVATSGWPTAAITECCFITTPERW